MGVPIPRDLRGGSSLLLDKVHLLPCIWKLCSGTGARWESTPSSFALLLSLGGWRVRMGPYSLTTCLLGFQNGLIRETPSEKLPVTLSVRSKDAVKHLLLLLKAMLDELLQWDQLARQSQHFAVVNWFLANWGEKLTSVHASCQAWGQLHLSIWSSGGLLFHRPLAETPDPKWLLAFQAGRGGGGVEDGGQGHGGAYFYIHGWFTSLLFCRAAAGWHPWQWEQEEARGLRAAALGGGPSDCLTPLQRPGTTGWMQQAASLSALPLFYHWGTCHRICAGAKPHISAAFIARLVLPCSSALLKTFVLGRAELHCYSPLSTNVSRITCMEMKCRHSYLVRWVWVSVLNLPSLLVYILWSSSLNIKNGNLKTISELVLLFQ